MTPSVLLVLKMCWPDQRLLAIKFWQNEVVHQMIVFKAEIDDLNACLARICGAIDEVREPIHIVKTCLNYRQTPIIHFINICFQFPPSVCYKIMPEHVNCLKPWSIMGASYPTRINKWSRGNASTNKHSIEIPLPVIWRHYHLLLKTDSRPRFFKSNQVTRWRNWVEQLGMIVEMCHWTG